MVNLHFISKISREIERERDRERENKDNKEVIDDPDDPVGGKW